jgi:glutamine---fructose-6-phosphate transaminase (isomerizing)
MNDPAATALFREAAEAGAVLRRQLQRNATIVARLGAELRRQPPRAVITCARGSSDHAATFAKYLIETRTGTLTASAAPSISSIYGARLDLHGCLCVVISQSGRSPDLLAAASAARAAGATVLALVNVEDSPLAELADHLLPLCAGTETSVAASKSFIGSLAALLQLVAAWSDDRPLQDALERAPDLLEQAWQLDWQAALPVLAPARHLYVIGRGPGLGIAQEIALKGKETCGLHAEAFSAAEVRHGPQALLAADFPALLLAQDDDSRAGLLEFGRELVERGVDVLVAGASLGGATPLPALAAPALLQPLLLVQSGYRLIDALARARGFDPDRPPHLLKVTETR